jgi:plectin
MSSAQESAEDPATQSAEDQAKRSAEDQAKLDAAALKIQARARGMNTRRLSKSDLAAQAEQSKRETKEERQARRKKEIQETNAKRFAAFEAQLETQKPLADATASELPVVAADMNAEVTSSPGAEGIATAAPIDIYEGLSEEEIKKRELAVVKIQSRARGVAIRSSDVKEKAAQRKKDSESARLEFQRRQLAENKDVHTMSAIELGRTSEDIRLEEQLSSAEHNLQSQAHSYADNLRKEAEYKKKREEELTQTSAASNDAAIEHATENKAVEVLLARQAEIAAQQEEQASMLSAQTFYSGENQTRQAKYVLEDVHGAENQSLKASKGQRNVMFEYNKPALLCSPLQKQALDLIYSTTPSNNSPNNSPKFDFRVFTTHNVLQKSWSSGRFAGSGHSTRCPSRMQIRRRHLS